MSRREYRTATVSLGGRRLSVNYRFVAARMPAHVGADSPRYLEPGAPARVSVVSVWDADRCAVELGPDDRAAVLRMVREAAGVACRGRAGELSPPFVSRPASFFGPLFERASFHETTKAHERAMARETTMGTERAMHRETTIREERAKLPETTMGRERATGSEQSTNTERASYCETTKAEERARAREATMYHERPSGR